MNQPFKSSRVPMVSIRFLWFPMVPYGYPIAFPANEVGLLLGKLHLHRCVLDPRETHLAKKAVRGVKSGQLG